MSQADTFPRTSEFGLGLRARIEALETAPVDILSPELVLVLPPEEARRARESLPEPLPWPKRPSPPQARRGRLGALAFAFFSLVDTVGPLAFVLIHLR